ncbi:MAG: hypothetical protein AAGI52_02900 [Bacteroidota bacterium]
MKPASVIRELEDALRKLSVRVRRERGSFRGGLCTVAGREVVVLNKLHPPEAQLVVLAEALRTLPHDQLYLRPAVRVALADAWSQLDAGVDSAAELASAASETDA